MGTYLPLALVGILSSELTGALSGPVVVNTLCGITGGLVGSLIPQCLGTRLQLMYGFAVVTAALPALGALATTSPRFSLGLLDVIIFFHSAGPDGLGMTVAIPSCPPPICPTSIGFARAITRTGVITGLIFWPVLWGALKTEAFYWLVIVPSLGFLACMLIKWELLGANVDAGDAGILAELDK